MQFKRLHDPLLKVLFENDEIIAIDKPYGICSHTNDAKAGNEGYIQHGLIELYEENLGRKLHIVHRLDQTTTGVIVFAKSLEAAAKFQAYFRERQTEKRYLFVTRSQISVSALTCDSPIVVKGSALAASTSFKRLKRVGAFDLWEALPKTGRNHQIRIHASELGIPLLGDTTYGGARYPFICLHNQSLRFPEGLVIESDAPEYFTQMKWLEEEWFAAQLISYDRRKRLFSTDTSPLRLSAGQDFFSEFIATSDGNARALARLSDFLKRDFLLHKQDDWVVVSSAGEETELTRHEWTVSENGLDYEVRAGVSASLGLSLDHRTQRAWIRAHARDREVLNLFAANCTASVAAAAGGASSVVSVELKKSALDWGRKNFALNEAPPAEPKFLCRDPITFISQSATKLAKFDMIICEVPSFLRREKGVFKIESDLEALLVDCLKCLSDGGDLLFSTTAATLSAGDLREKIESAARTAGVRGVQIFNVLPSLDVALPGETTATKTFLVSRSAQR